MNTTLILAVFLALVLISYLSKVIKSNSDLKKKNKEIEELKLQNSKLIELNDSNTLNTKLKNFDQRLNDIIHKPLRRGYIKFQLTTTEEDIAKRTIFTSIVFIIETNRFINGESEISIERIEAGISPTLCTQKAIENHLRSQVPSICKSSDITWLEPEVSIKEQRKAKLEQLKEDFKEDFKEELKNNI